MAHARAVAPAVVALRNAVQGRTPRLRVILPDDDVRRRIAAALSGDGDLVLTASLGALPSLPAGRDDGADLAIFVGEERGHDVAPLTVAAELHPRADLVPLIDAGASEVIGDAFARGAAAVLPLPMEIADALLRAHLRWLAACQRARAVALAVRAAFGAYRGELARDDPRLAAAVESLLADSAAELCVASGGAELPSGASQAAVARLEAAQRPDALVWSLAADAPIDREVANARRTAGGAALVLVDHAPSAARARVALFSGARAYLPGDMAGAVLSTARQAGGRRRGELLGRRLIETMARFGVFADGPASDAGGDPAPRLVDEAAARGEAVVPSGHEVLIVDDEPVVLMVLREALGRGGYRVTTAASGEEAIALLRQRGFDLVLTDKNLPGLSGLDVLSFARTLTPPPAVVLITGYSSYDSAAEALERGALDYIEKPIKDVAVLRQRIRRALSRRDELLARAAVAASAGHINRRARVLLVEREGERRRLMTDYLAQDYDVFAVAGDHDAHALLERIDDQEDARFDVVLAERNLPGLSGLRIIEQARRLLPGCASVLYTTYPSYESVKEAFELGVDAYLVHPGDDLRTLGAKVAAALRNRGIMLG